jgi:hypothetical protein
MLFLYLIDVVVSGAIVEVFILFVLSYISDSQALILSMSSWVVCPPVNRCVWIGARFWQSWLIASLALLP